LKRIVEDRTDSPAEEETKEFVEYILRLTDYN